MRVVAVVGSRPYLLPAVAGCRCCCSVWRGDRPSGHPRRGCSTAFSSPASLEVDVAAIPSRGRHRRDTVRMTDPACAPASLFLCARLDNSATSVLLTGLQVDGAVVYPRGGRGRPSGHASRGRACASAYPSGQQMNGADVPLGGLHCKLPGSVVVPCRHGSRLQAKENAMEICVLDNRIDQFRELLKKRLICTLESLFLMTREGNTNQ